MGLYREQVLPRLVDLACGMAEIGPWRAQVTEGLAGRVVEIGFGSGLNARYYPSDVDLVLAVEPAALARRMAVKRMATAGVAVTHVGLDGQAIVLDDASCDSALSTFTLCTVPDPVAVLREVRRVLRPGGRLHFLEHGIAPDPGVARWQHRLEPFQRRLAGGCHLTRSASELVGEAGFVIESDDQRYARGPKPWSWFTIGVAASPTVATVPTAT